MRMMSPGDPSSRATLATAASIVPSRRRAAHNPARAASNTWHHILQVAAGLSAFHLFAARQESPGLVGRLAEWLKEEMVLGKGVGKTKYLGQ